MMKTEFNLLNHSLNSLELVPDDPKPSPRPIRDPWGATILDGRRTTSASLNSQKAALALLTTEDGCQTYSNQSHVSASKSNGAPTIHETLTVSNKAQLRVAKDHATLPQEGAARIRSIRSFSIRFNHAITRVI